MNSGANDKNTESKIGKNSLFAGIFPKLLGMGLLLGALFGLTVFSAVLETGHRLAQVHGALMWVFYVFLSIAIIWLGIFPFLSVFTKKTRDWSPLVDQNSSPSDAWLNRQAKYMLKNIDLSKEENRKLQYHLTFKKDLNSCLKDIVEKKAEAMDSVVLNKSKVAFLAVSVSQNGPLDTFLLLTINLSLIKNVVSEMGIRPSLPDLLKLYLLVGIGALVIDQINDLEFGDALPAVGTIAGKSAAQGIGAALVTLRVGYLTKAYLIHGQSKTHKKEARQWARLKIRNVIISGLSELPKNLAKKIESILPSLDIGKLVKRPQTSGPELKTTQS